MKKRASFVVFVSVTITLLLNACGASATPNTGAGKVEAIPVAFTGIVESMAGDQWVINGKTVTVDPSVVRDGPFKTDDRVKVEGVVNSDGSFSVSRVEAPTSEDLSTLPQFGDDNSNTTNANDANINDANINNGIVNVDNSNTANANDININNDNSTNLNANDDNSNAANVNAENGNTTNSNDDNGNSVNSNSSTTNSDNSNSGGNTNTGGGNDNGGGKGGGGNDNGGNSNGG
jgi:uncharacterized membrane protein YgcG